MAQKPPAARFRLGSLFALMTSTAIGLMFLRLLGFHHALYVAPLIATAILAGSGVRMARLCILPSILLLIGGWGWGPHGAVMGCTAGILGDLLMWFELLRE